MKEFLKSYLHFSTTERRGIVALLVIITLLLVSLFSMRYFLPSTSMEEVDSSLLASWNQYKLKHTATSEINEITLNGNTANLFYFDPNTLDSIGFIRLGMKPKTTHLLLNWRRKGKVFYQKEELKKLYTLSEEEYNRLEPYITVGNSSSGSFSQENTAYKNKYAPEPDHLDINTTDSATLVRLRGIGPYFAHKILERRKALGGFIKHEQLLEAYKFNDTTFAILKEKLITNPNNIQKINLNSSTEQILTKHPYIGEKMAKNIILYRNAIKRFEKIEQLRQVPLMNEENYRKIVPYLSIE